MIKFLVVRTYLSNEIKKGLNLRLKSRREVAVELEDDPQANEAVLFVVRHQNVHGDPHQFLHVRPQDLVQRKHVQNL